MRPGNSKRAQLQKSKRAQYRLETEVPSQMGEILFLQSEVEFEETRKQYGSRGLCSSCDRFAVVRTCNAVKQENDQRILCGRVDVPRSSWNQCMCLFVCIHLYMRSYAYIYIYDVVLAILNRSLPHMPTWICWLSPKRMNQRRHVDETCVVDIFVDG